MTVVQEAALVGFVLAVMLGISIGIIGSRYYVNWRLGKMWGDGPKSLFQQLFRDRADDYNALRDSIMELEQLHISAGGLLRDLNRLKGQIEWSMGNLNRMKTELKIAAVEMPELEPQTTVVEKLETIQAQTTQFG